MTLLDGAGVPTNTTYATAEGQEAAGTPPYFVEMTPFRLAR